LLLRLHAWPLTLSPGWLPALHRLLTTLLLLHYGISR
jgi:hypothetical protein